MIVFLKRTHIYSLHLKNFHSRRTHAGAYFLVYSVDVFLCNYSYPEVRNEHMITQYFARDL